MNREAATDPKLALGLKLLRLLCHDLANPVALIVLGLEAVRSTRPEEAGKSFSMIKKGAEEQKRHLVRIKALSSLLASSAPKSGLDPNQLVFGILEGLESHVMEKSLIVEFKASPKTGEVSLAREAFKHLVLEELLFNAVIFAPEGSRICVKINASKKAGHERLTIENSWSEVEEAGFASYFAKPLTELVEKVDKKGLLLARYAVHAMGQELTYQLMDGGVRIDLSWDHGSG
jgi:hypothetical protein